MNFCPKCGANLPEGAIFCGECGMALTNDPVQPQQAQVQQPQHQQPMQQPQYQQPVQQPQYQQAQVQQPQYQQPVQQPQYQQPIQQPQYQQPVQQPQYQQPVQQPQYQQPMQQPLYQQPMQQPQYQQPIQQPQYQQPMQQPQYQQPMQPGMGYAPQTQGVPEYTPLPIAQGAPTIKVVIPGMNKILFYCSSALFYNFNLDFNGFVITPSGLKYHKPVNITVPINSEYVKIERWITTFFLNKKFRFKKWEFQIDPSQSYILEIKYPVLFYIIPDIMFLKFQLKDINGNVLLEG